MTYNPEQELTITAEDGAVVIRLHPADAMFVQNAFRTHAVEHGDDEIVVESAFDIILGIDTALDEFGWDRVKLR